MRIQSLSLVFFSLTLLNSCAKKSTNTSTRLVFANSSPQLLSSGSSDANRANYCYFVHVMSPLVNVYNDPKTCSGKGPQSLGIVKGFFAYNSEAVINDLPVGGGYRFDLVAIAKDSPYAPANCAGSIVAQHRPTSNDSGNVDVYINGVLLPDDQDEMYLMSQGFGSIAPGENVISLSNQPAPFPAYTCEDRDWVGKLPNAAISNIKLSVAADGQALMVGMPGVCGAGDCDSTNVAGFVRGLQYDSFTSQIFTRQSQAGVSNGYAGDILGNAVRGSGVSPVVFGLTVNPAQVLGWIGPLYSSFVANQSVSAGAFTLSNTIQMASDNGAIAVTKSAGSYDYVGITSYAENFVTNFFPSLSARIGRLSIDAPYGDTDLNWVSAPSFNSGGPYSASASLYRVYRCTFDATAGHCPAGDFVAANTDVSSAVTSRRIYDAQVLRLPVDDGTPNKYVYASGAVVTSGSTPWISARALDVNTANPPLMGSEPISSIAIPGWSSGAAYFTRRISNQIITGGSLGTGASIRPVLYVNSDGDGTTWTQKLYLSSLGYNSTFIDAQEVPGQPDLVALLVVPSLSDGTPDLSANGEFRVVLKHIYEF